MKLDRVFFCQNRRLLIRINKLKVRSGSRVDLVYLFTTR